MTEAAANAAVTILVSYVMIRLGLRASRRVGFGDAHAHGLGRWRLSTCSGSRSSCWRRNRGCGGHCVTDLAWAWYRLICHKEREEPARWMGLLASANAGVTEEILFRLGLMTSMAWLLTVLTRRPAAGPLIVLVANVLAVLAFAASAPAAGQGILRSFNADGRCCDDRQRSARHHLRLALPGDLDSSRRWLPTSEPQMSSCTSSGRSSVRRKAPTSQRRPGPKAPGTPSLKWDEPCRVYSIRCSV